MTAYDCFMQRHLSHYGYFSGRNISCHSQSTAAYERSRAYGYAGLYTRATSSDQLDSADDSNEPEDIYDCELGSNGRSTNYKDNTTQEELLRTTQLIYSYQAGKMVPRLREPRQLYGLNSSKFGPQQFARWPSDIQVLPERVKHISAVPVNPELFYQPTGLEKTPMALSHLDEGRTVFFYEPQVGTFFMKSRVGGHRGGCLPSCIELTSTEDTTLLFESRFESGNLGRAVQVGPYDYELWLRKDLYTTKHTQWYYFRVTNTKANVNYRFTIVNLNKPSSLYNEGMKPLMYSEKNATETKIGWVRCGNEIKYYKNNIKCGSSDKGDRYYYSLTWRCTLPHDGDTVYFAHCYPYMYADLQDYLNEIATDPVKSKLCKTRVLCRTLAGNMVYILTITSPCKTLEENKSRKGIVITARIHPGETNSSWMMKGFLDYLIGDSPDAKLLRDMFVFKVVPMLNPDGVIIGNYRCSLTGRDLNRNYKTMLKDSFPSVWHTKNMVRKLLEEREVVVYLDLHGHSRRQNVFIYGCENRNVPSRRLHERVFPVMLGKNAPEKFRYESCKFHIQKSKEGTGRVVMWNMGIMNSYTMEATFCGSSLGKRKGQHFTIADFESMGYHFCDTLLEYTDPERAKSNHILMDIETQLKQEILQRLKLNEGSEFKDIDDINLEDYMSDVESSDGGSDSSASDGLPMQLQYMSKKTTSKKKRLRSKKDRNNHRTTSLKESQKKVQLTPMSTAVMEKKMDTKTAKTAVSVKYLSLKNDRLLINPEPEPTIKNDGSYLENITNIYLQNGIIVPSEQEKAIPHFRYTAANSMSAAYAARVCTIQDPSPPNPMTSVTSATSQRGTLSHLQQFKYPDGNCMQENSVCGAYVLDDLPKPNRSSSGIKRPTANDAAASFHAISTQLQNCLSASPPAVPIQQMCMMPQESSSTMHHCPLPFETIPNSLQDTKRNSATRRCASSHSRKRPPSRAIQGLHSAKPYVMPQTGRDLCQLGTPGARNAIITGNSNAISQKEPAGDVVVESLSSGVIYPFMEHEGGAKDPSPVAAGKEGDTTEVEHTVSSAGSGSVKEPRTDAKITRSKFRRHRSVTSGPMNQSSAGHNLSNARQKSSEHSCTVHRQGSGTLGGAVSSTLGGAVSGTLGGTVSLSASHDFDTELQQATQALHQIRQSFLDSMQRNKLGPTSGQLTNNADDDTKDISTSLETQLVLDADENGSIRQQCQLPNVNKAESSTHLREDAVTSSLGSTRPGTAGTTGTSRGTTRPSTVGHTITQLTSTETRLGTAEFGKSRFTAAGLLTTGLGTAVTMGLGRTTSTVGTMSSGTMGQTQPVGCFTRQQIEEGLCQGYVKDDAATETVPTAHLHSTLLGLDYDVTPSGFEKTNHTVSTSYPCSVPTTTTTRTFEIKDADRTSDASAQSEDCQLTNGRRKIGCPTTISLMMSHTHHHSELPPGQFYSHPLTRSSCRPPLIRNLRR